MGHRNMAELLAGLDHVRAAPRDNGLLQLIVCRPVPGERETLSSGELTLEDGLVGDGWLARGSRQSPDGSAELPRQVTLMSSRAAALFAGDRSRWPLAGDQLYVDLDVSSDNVPAGTRLRIGAAILEISVEPHTGCQKFTERFGVEATRLLRSPEGSPLQLRGVNARVIEPGTVSVGDSVDKVPVANLNR
ncbi:MAG TPA: MOSC domain-containing protein [Acidimicrobiales bacterium]|nr:MOSC domain-containing protein [Acidimicrobiales bacterium]